MQKRHGPKHHGRGKKKPGGPHDGVSKARVHRRDFHHNTKIASGGGMGRDKANTTVQTGNRPVRLTNQEGRRAKVQKHGKFSHDVLI